MSNNLTVNVTPSIRIHNNNKDFQLLKKSFIDSGGTADKFEQLDIIESQLIAFVEINTHSFPEVKFGKDNPGPSIQLEDSDAFLVNRVSMGFVSVPKGEEIDHQEIIYFNCPEEFAYQSEKTVQQYKAMQVLYNLNFALYNNTKQVEFHGSNLKRVPRCKVSNHYHYPNGVWHNLSTPTLFKGTEVFYFKPESVPRAEIESLRGDAELKKMYVVASVGGLLIRNGSESINSKFGNRCLK